MKAFLVCLLGVFGIVGTAVLIYCISENNRNPKGTITILGQQDHCLTWRVYAGPYGGEDATVTHCEGKSETLTLTPHCHYNTALKQMQCATKVQENP